MKIVYLNCPGCGGEYYVERGLYLEQKRDPEIRLICPYCHQEFYGKETQFKEN